MYYERGERENGRVKKKVEHWAGAGHPGWISAHHCCDSTAEKSKMEKKKKTPTG